MLIHVKMSNIRQFWGNLEEIWILKFKVKQQDKNVTENECANSKWGFVVFWVLMNDSDQLKLMQQKQIREHTMGM